MARAAAASALRRIALPGDFFDRPAFDLAPALLGCRVVRHTQDGRTSSGLIVETEAYDGPEDRASHARFGRTARTAPMFGPGGRAYVYLVYGMHWCLNVVAGPTGRPGAVLVRALASLDGPAGLAVGAGPADRSVTRAAAGPGRLTRVLAIDGTLDGVDLTRSGPLWLAAAPADALERLGNDGVVVGPRIGVAYAGTPWAEVPWRFGWRGHPALSRPFPREARAAP
ncbi:MAG: DNA-3-methyladenine glycosylase [Candidatus Limnocylindrales bacterium]